ncbi:MAG: transposase [Dehalococcoidia bacterium]|nr:transposase [Dehalococcoidia bacterium]
MPDVVRRFKSLTAAKYRQGIRDNGWPPFPRRLWQRNYYEHVIRDDEDLDRIRRYVAENPLRWKEDPENVL